MQLMMPMKKYKIFKIAGILLLFILSFSLLSCDDKKEIEYDENIRIEITKEHAEYDVDDLTDANVRFTKAAASLTEAYAGIDLKDKDMREISDKFNEKILPMLYRVKIYKEELDTILSEIEKFASSENIQSNTEPLLLSIYEICLYVLGTERSGHLTYELSLELLNNRKVTALERFDKYGMSFYKIDASRCAMLYEDLEGLGQTKFTDALFMTSIVFSTAKSILNDAGESAFLFTDEELLFILEKQGESLKERCLSEDEWQIFGGLISEFIPKNSSDLNSATLYALKNFKFETDADIELPEGYYKNLYFASAIRIMPKVISLFADTSKSLREENSFSLEGDTEEKLLALCSALMANEGGLRELDMALNTCAKLGENDLKTPIGSNSDTEELNGFMESYTALSCEGLIDAIEGFKNKGEISYETLIDALVSYVFGLSPYLAFVLSVNIK